MQIISQRGYFGDYEFLMNKEQRICNARCVAEAVILVCKISTFFDKMVTIGNLSYDYVYELFTEKHEQINEYLLRQNPKDD